MAEKVVVTKDGMISDKASKTLLTTTPEEWEVVGVWHQLIYFCVVVGHRFMQWSCNIFTSRNPLV